MPGEQKKVCIDVPYIDQSKLYPTGCESVSTVMLLRFLGIDITVDEFIEKYLEKKSFEERDGQVYGPDPHRYFCGSPYDDESFGCYAPVIREALEKIIGAEYTVTDETGMTTDELVEKYIDQGMPVIYWACINMRDPIVGPQWKLLDTGETFTWISNEHCMLLVGYDEDSYYFNDPYNSNGTVKYHKNLVTKRWEELGKQSVVLVPTAISK